jgi:hypothetical protein
LNFKSKIKFFTKRFIPKKVIDVVRELQRKRRRRKLITEEFRKVEITKKRLLKENIDILEKYKSSSVPEETSRSYVVWVMWWQGEDEMPPIITMNYNSLKRNANGHKINLITNQNYLNFVELPDFIISKFENKIINLTHLSDIIRVTLLSQCGGLWLDATIYVTAPLPEEMNVYYWSTKWVLDRNEKNSYPLWRALWNISSIPKLTITQCIGIWFSCPNNPIFDCLKDFWLEYWKNERNTPYYWTTEVFLNGIMYDKIPAVKNMIDEVTESNSHVFKMRHHISQDYNDQILRELTRDTQFFYLSWKERYHEISPETRNKTLYGFLRDKDLDAKVTNAKITDEK